MSDVANNSTPEIFQRDLTRISEVYSYSTRPNTQGLKKCVVLFSELLQKSWILYPRWETYQNLPFEKDKE